MSAYLARWYRRFHRATPQVSRAVVPAPRAVADLGELVAVTYRRPGGDMREHFFSPASRPTIGRDEAGQPVLYGGASRVTERGIEDMKAQSATSALALHDARRRLTPQGVPVYGQHAPPEGIAVVRLNPVDELVDGAMDLGRAALHTAGAGLVGFVAKEGSDALVERTPWSEGWRAAAQGVTLGLGGLGFLRAVPVVGEGLIGAAIVSAGGRMYRYHQLDRRVARFIESLRGTPAQREASGVYSDPLPFEVKTEAVQDF